ncbi:hypothetical protein [Actinocorallia aurantiaca]|uniref:Uncharacterized protein n=1 Tax=Actinocorallia aurantiaca TaxID=46204 RepID=A0ABN3U2M5_9ACTN
MYHDLTYGHKGNAPFAFLEAAGQVTGLPPAHQLHFLLWSDPNTRDSENNPGNGLFSWAPDQEISPDSDGCWKLPPSTLSYSRAQGLSFRFHVVALPASQRPCLEDVYEIGEKDKDLRAHQLTACGLTFLDHVKITTKRL